MFPLDYRYGWDLGSPAHRRLIDEIEETFQPDVDFMSPSCPGVSLQFDEVYNKLNKNEKKKCL